MKVMRAMVLGAALGLWSGFALGQNSMEDGDTMEKKEEKTLNATVVGDAKTTGDAVGDQTVCKNGELTRKVSIEYPAGEDIGCKVVYEKPSEGQEAQTLWTAVQNKDFCKQKTAEFVDKLKGWGWDCSTN